MSTRSLVISTSASAGILLAGWQAGLATLVTGDTADDASTTPTTTSPTTTTPSTQTTTNPSSRSTGSSTGSTSTTTPAASTEWADGTWTGTAASNRYGSWTVTVTISNGKITDVSADTTANDRKSQQINSRAVPTLRSEVIAAQSTDVSTVSGATLTTDSYLTSLQAALDEAAA